MGFIYCLEPRHYARVPSLTNILLLQPIIPNGSLSLFTQLRFQPVGKYPKTIVHVLIISFSRAVRIHVTSSNLLSVSRQKLRFFHLTVSSLRAGNRRGKILSLLLFDNNRYRPTFLLLLFILCFIISIRKPMICIRL